MTGDQADMAARLRAALPQGWFADDAPILTALLNGLGNVWAWLYALLAFAQQQTRLATASGGWLDLIAQDYGGAGWARESGESDQAFKARIAFNLRRLRGTRGALVANVTMLTGRTPLVFEPANTADTGGYNTAGIGWSLTGGWGSLNLPYQCFVVAYRPKGGGIADVGGWGTTVTGFALGGWNTAALAWGDASLIRGAVTDAQILATVADSMPAATIAWTALSN
ncbi:hypothetical protein ACELLULO517_09270 [Acidisoma cellulosilytica]|uniref:Uncharacterized protein n=1 Tax=Acidisoma cellulosilyticum TaxID=2802395 RepID=A0A963Z0R1_9PROT|nr:acetylxylan esterase [Acidisoma cellulosilyticum]MCB8880421.1 hypothetical protein [Acidisoma cellulosilyticum]